MLKSIEIRWFFKEPLSDIYLNSFKKSCNLVNQESRSDYYLAVKDCKSVGIKLRNSRLEIKWQIDSKLFTTSFNGIQGKLERCTRWECNDPDSCNHLLQTISLNKDNPWIKVDKIRLQKKFNLIDKTMIEVSPNNLKYDFAIEITDLKIHTHQWWSIGVDSFKGNNHMDYFRQLIENYIDKNVYPYLRSESSYSYPEWLSNICKIRLE